MAFLLDTNVVSELRKRERAGVDTLNSFQLN
jgi:predicted nucleic acid-binding protein